VVTLVFVGVILVVVAIDMCLIQPYEKRHASTKAKGIDTAVEFVVPRTLFFHPGHTWLRLDDDGLVTVGIDDFARTLIGDFSTVEPPEVGSQLRIGEPLIGVRTGGGQLSLVAPVSGTVAESNTALGKDTVRLRWRPYKEGWVARLAPGDALPVELAGLTIGRDAERWMCSELDRLTEIVENGTLEMPLEGTLQRVDSDLMARMEREVFKNRAEASERRA
jgi:glycine cleavage system H protein